MSAQLDRPALRSSRCRPSGAGPAGTIRWPVPEGRPRDKARPDRRCTPDPCREALSRRGLRPRDSLGTQYWRPPAIHGFVSRRNIRLGKEGDNVPLLERVLPLGPLSNKNGIGGQLPAGCALALETYGSSSEKIERHAARQRRTDCFVASSRTESVGFAWVCLKNLMHARRLRDPGFSATSFLLANSDPSRDQPLASASVSFANICANKWPRLPIINVQRSRSP